MAGRKVNIRIHFSGQGWTSNKQELNGGEPCSMDFKRWALAEGKSVVILHIYDLKLPKNK
jgi:hypothetical protein